jgi:hypothetical protein
VSFYLIKVSIKIIGATKVFKGRIRLNLSSRPAHFINRYAMRQYHIPICFMQLAMVRTAMLFFSQLDAVSDIPVKYLTIVFSMCSICQSFIGKLF